MVKNFMVWCIRLVSMTFRAMGWRACRFHPTCSEYSVQAFGRFGGWKASVMSFARVLRCQPFCAGGFDPLPKE